MENPTVHDGVIAHSGGLMTPSLDGGTISLRSNKDRLSTQSSTEGEIVSVDGFLTKIIWTNKLMVEAGYKVKGYIY